MYRTSTHVQEVQVQVSKSTSTSKYKESVARASSESVSVVSEAKETKVEDNASPWSQVEDPDSGAKYWYNSVTGASQWEQP